MKITIDQKFMQIALEEAERAAQLGEVPVGAVWVSPEGEIVQGRNCKENECDPTGHAELNVIRQAAQVCNNWRLGGTLYVTLEPCTMCFGAIIQARIETVVFGCRDEKAGVLGSVLDLASGYPWNHQVKVRQGILENDCRSILQDFFSKRREENKRRDGRAGRRRLTRNQLCG